MKPAWCSILLAALTIHAAPVVRVQGPSSSPCQVSIAFESLRPMQGAAAPLPSGGTAAVLFEDQPDRLEFTMENPGYQRGQSQRFELQVRQPDGSCRTVHSSHVFGTIYAEEFAPVTAQQVRLNISAKVVQFDLFNGKN